MAPRWVRDLPIGPPVQLGRRLKPSESRQRFCASRANIRRGCYRNHPPLTAGRAARLLDIKQDYSGTVLAN
ncbi:MAG: hypothetical protein QOG46_2535 [Pseudonocardiales bacterium]|jgi:hypothetical protein|nr:hypothetical protein [Pseudonocardiales bacterium]